MNIDEVKVGMKVVPISKSIGKSLENSDSWKKTKKANKPFLYASDIKLNCEGSLLDPSDKGCDAVVCGRFNNKQGDYFLAEDLIPYVEENTMDDFIDGKISLNLHNDSDLIMLANYCKDRGINVSRMDTSRDYTYPDCVIISENKLTWYELFTSVEFTPSLVGNTIEKKDEPVITSIVSDGFHKTTIEQNGKKAESLCNPTNKFDLLEGVKVAIEHLKEKNKFIPHMEGMATNYGPIGIATNLTDMFGHKLFSGDTVIVCDKEDTAYHHELPVVSKQFITGYGKDYDFIMGWEAACENFDRFKKDYIVIRAHAYKEIDHNEVVNSMKYIKEEDK